MESPIGKTAICETVVVLNWKCFIFETYPHRVWGDFNAYEIVVGHMLAEIEKHGIIHSIHILSGADSSNLYSFGFITLHTNELLSIQNLLTGYSRILSLRLCSELYTCTVSPLQYVTAPSSSSTLITTCVEAPVSYTHLTLPTKA